MINLMILFLLALALGIKYEGTCKSKSILASCTFLRVGRLGVRMWSYRPGRVYFRMERLSNQCH